MDRVIEDFLRRNLPRFKDNFRVTITNDTKDNYAVTAKDGMVAVCANNYISAIHGIYSYLKDYVGVQLSWCGNRHIDIDHLVMFDGVYTKNIEEKWRVYMNYCTLDYSMVWWDFPRWEREIDFMAMNGINMPLGVMGSEAVWYETLLEYGIDKKDALSTVTGPAFYAWHLMTNIDSYLPPPSESYIYERLELARKILARYRELGMTPIMQGFSGHVPLLLKTKFPHAKISKKSGWCGYPKTGQLDPLDPLFEKFGLSYLRNMERLLGGSHYIACDPFHEGCPPKNSKKYLSAVGSAIDRLYRTFDNKSVWVIQGWTPRADIIKAVPKDRLLILDLPSDRYKNFDNFYGYEVVSGMLHNFGGKNAMQGKIRRHTTNAYKRMRDDGVNVVGTGMFMEGIGQNPVVYDLQFRMLTESTAIDYDTWLHDYISRRYGKDCDALSSAWHLMMQTCYSDKGYEENEVGSALASRPQLMPVRTGPCCFAKIWYDTRLLEEVLLDFVSVADEYRPSDGYQYDLTDLARQVLSNRFYNGQLEYAKAVKKKDAVLARKIADRQLELLLDIDDLLTHRSELSFENYIMDSHALATSEEEKKYYDLNARTLVTLWGDINGTCYALYDYAWREWSGLIREYYYKRWEIYYNYMISGLNHGKRLKEKALDDYAKRKHYRDTEIGKMLYDFELDFVKTYKEYERVEDRDVVETARNLIDKWKIGK